MSWFEDSDLGWRYKQGWQMVSANNGIQRSPNYGDVAASSSLFFDCSWFDDGSGYVERFTHSGDFVLTETHQSATGHGGEAMVVVGSVVFVLDSINGQIHVLSAADLSLITNIAINPCFPSLFVGNGFVWAVEDAASSQILYRIDTSTYAKTEITLSYPSKGLSVVWNAGASVLYVDCPYGAYSMLADGTSQDLQPTNGYCVPHNRTDGDLGLIIDNGTYKIRYTTTTNAISGVIYKIPRLLTSERLFSSDGTLISYVGLELGQFNKGVPTNIILNTTQTVAQVEDTKYVYRAFKGSEATLDVNPDAAYRYNVTYYNDDPTTEKQIFSSDPWVLRNGYIFTARYMKEDGAVYFSSSAVTQMATDMYVRPNTITLNSQCSFNGV